MHTAAAGAGNVVPVPEIGIAADMLAMSTMAMSLCAVFGGNSKEEAAKSLAVAAVKNTMLKQPVRVLAKELSRLIPGLGQIVAPSTTVVMLEAAGWVLAEELDQAQSKKALKRTKAKAGSIAAIIQESFAPAIEGPASGKDAGSAQSTKKSTKVKAGKSPRSPKSRA